MIGIEVALERGLQLGDGGESLAVDIQKLSASRHPAFEILVRQNDCTVDEIAEDRHQLAVVAGLEVLPAEIVVLGLRSVGGTSSAENKAAIEAVTASDLQTLAQRIFSPENLSRLIYL